MSDSAHEVWAFLKPRLETRSAQLAERGTDMMVADATPEKDGLASSKKDLDMRALGDAVAATLTFTT